MTSTEQGSLAPGLADLTASSGAQLIGGRCEACSRIVFPYRERCSECGSRQTRSIRLSRLGRLYSYTVCHVAPLGWSAPYFQAYVELPEGVFVFGLISSEVPVDFGSLSVGMNLEVVAEAVEVGGRPHMTYVFRPVDSSEPIVGEKCET